jgi:uncharacterized protein
MNKTGQGGIALLGLCVLLGLGLLGYQLAGAALAVKNLERTVTVKGLSEQEVAATVATWPVSFQLADNNLDALFARIDTNTQIIIDFLAEYGISGDEVTLSAPEVTDLFAQQWGNKQNITFRYTANASVTVYSKNIDAVRKAMANLVALGKKGIVISRTNMHEQQFLFTELSALKPTMIEDATKNARAVAEKFAQDSNSKLGKIKSARQGQFSITDRDSTTPHIKKVRVVTTVEYYLSD